MTRHTHAIVRTPGRSFADGITTADLGRPDHGRMLEQHAAYVDALRGLGLEVEVLDALEAHPDAHFVEDTAVVTSELAVVTRPGAAARRGEELAIEEALGRHRPLRRIRAPGTVDGGDVLEVDGHFFVGLSERTNADGARQLAAFLGEAGYTVSTLPVGDGLHLKSSLNELGGRRLILTEELAGLDALAGYEQLVVPADEVYACNALFVNGTVLIASGYPRTRAAVLELGLPVLELDTSEARKMDGGLTCLSLRF